MATSQIIVVPIIPKDLSAFDKQKYARRLKSVVFDETGVFDTLYYRVGKGFEETPVFKREMKVIGGDLVGTTSTKSKPFIFIDTGFQQTYQGVPTDDWRARTTPRVLGIKGRQGGLKFVNTQKTGKKVEGREYSDEIAKRREKPFTKKVEDAMK